jgi:hypothetical protein
MNNTSGFVAGTLVHTDNGLVPIQDIKIGDMVLSKPEGGEGDLAYQPVTEKFFSDDMEVWALFYNTYYPNDSMRWDRDLKVVFVTGGHPIWIQKYEHKGADGFIEVNNWVRPDELFNLGAVAKTIVFLDGKFIEIYAQPILTTPYADVGYIVSEWDGDPEFIIEFKDDKAMAFNIDHIFEGLDPDSPYFEPSYDINNIMVGREDIDVVKRFLQCYEKNSHGGFYERYKTRVYNFDVANYHTYFVEERGIWAKNTN